MKVLLNEAISQVTAEEWQGCIRHVQTKIEVEMWEMDNIIDNLQEKIIVEIGNDSSSSDSCSSDEDDIMEGIQPLPL